MAISGVLARQLSAAAADADSASQQNGGKDSKNNAMDWKTLLWVGLAVSAYLLLGGLLFNYLEHQNEADSGASLQTTVRRFLDQHPGLEPNNLSDFLLSVGGFYSAGYRIDQNGTILVPPSKWDFSSAVFFCLTVVTTIGYGNLAPSTPHGQTVCCIYALIGIPLLAIFLGGLSGRWKAAQERLHSSACCKKRGRLAAVMFALFYAVLSFSLFFAVPAAIFTYTESWTFSLSLYYCLITLTTIGFGDFVAGQKVQSDVYKFCLFSWIFLGMIFVSGLIQAVQGILEKGSQVVHDQGLARMRNLEEHLAQQLGGIPGIITSKFHTDPEETVDCECQHHCDASADRLQRMNQPTTEQQTIEQQEGADQQVTKEQTTEN